LNRYTEADLKFFVDVCDTVQLSPFIPQFSFKYTRVQLHIRSSHIRLTL